MIVDGGFFGCWFLFVCGYSAVVYGGFVLCMNIALWEYGGFFYRVKDVV